MRDRPGIVQQSGHDYASVEGDISFGFGLAAQDGFERQTARTMADRFGWNCWHRRGDSARFQEGGENVRRFLGEDHGSARQEEVTLVRVADAIAAPGREARV